MRDALPRLRLVLSVTVGLIALVLILRSVDIPLLMAQLGGANPLWLLLALGVFLLSLLGRALRLAWMYPEEPPLLWQFRTVSLAAVLNFLLPVRLGELGLVALIDRRVKTGMGSAAISLIAIRLQEFLFSLLLAGLLLVATGAAGLQFLLDEIEIQQLLLWITGLVVVVAVGLAFRFRGVRLLERARRHLCDPPVLASSAWVALMMFGLIFCLAQWLQLPQSLTLTPLIFLALLLVSLLPVNGIANLGGYHLAWVLPLTASGMALEQAVTLSVLAHLAVSLLILVAALCVIIMDLVGGPTESSATVQIESNDNTPEKTL